MYQYIILSSVTTNITIGTTTTKLGQKCPIENRVRNTNRKFHQKLWKISDNRWRTRVRAKYRRFQNTITFDLRQILTCPLKLCDDIAEILPYLNF